MLLYDLLWNALCYFIYLIGSRYFEQREGKKNIEGKKKELLELLIEEISEDVEPISTENIINLPDAMLCMKQCEKVLQN